MKRGVLYLTSVSNIICRSKAANARLLLVSCILSDTFVARSKYSDTTHSFSVTKMKNLTAQYASRMHLDPERLGVCRNESLLSPFIATGSNKKTTKLPKSVL